MKTQKIEPVLSQKIFDSIPCLSDDPELQEIDRKILFFEGILKAKKQEFSETRSYPGEVSPPAKLDSEKDGLFLIGNGDVDALVSNQSVNRRNSLLRQISALQAGISILQNNRRHAMKKVIQQACVNLPGPVKQIFRNIIIAAENLESSIKEAIKVDEILNARGVESARRDGRFIVVQFWRDLLFRGLGNGPSMGFIIESQKKLWEDQS